MAFQYTIGNQTYQVGELTTNGPNSYISLILKLLKGTTFSPSLKKLGIDDEKYLYL